MRQGRVGGRVDVVLVAEARPQCEPRLGLSVASAGCLIVEVAIEADFFALGHEKLGDIVPDLRVRLCQAVVDANSLCALRADLRRWETGHTSVRRQISAGSLPALTVEIGERDGVICAPEQPVFNVRYEGSLTHVEHGFVVDQSCVGICSESLARVIEGTPATGS